MKDPGSLEGWAPEVGTEVTLAEVVERAFDYRGNVTIVRRDGVEVVGYVFNRSADAPVPFIELFDLEGEGPFRLPYADIRTIRFTGRDTAAGNSYAAWLRSREAARSGKDNGSSPGGPAPSA